MTAVGTVKQHAAEQGSIRFAFPAIHLNNILQMGTIPALAATACPSSFFTAINRFDTER